MGVTFANFYMSDLENKVFNEKPELQPKIFCRYVDDCFLLTESDHQLDALVEAFRSHSVLDFTIEKGLNHSINFLDVKVDSLEGNFVTNVYKKPTNP